MNLLDIENERAQFRYCIIRDVNPLSNCSKSRKIFIPNLEMKQVHEEINRYLEGLNISLPYATAFNKGNSALKNVQRHTQTNHFYYYVTDIKNAYPSLKGTKIAKVLCVIDPSLNYNKVLSLLKRYCLDENNSLIVGGPATNQIFNLCMHYLIDIEIGNYCLKQKILYTRYADDLVFSANEPIGKRKRLKILRIINTAGFEINHKKSKTADIRKQPIFFCGFGTEMKNGKSRIFISKKYRKMLFGLLHLAINDFDINSSEVHGKMTPFVHWFNNTKSFKTSLDNKLINFYEEYKKLLKNFRKRV